jgi:hypothetical protein
MRIAFQRGVDLTLGALLNLIHRDGARAVQVFGFAQQAVTHRLGGQTALVGLVQADLIRAR